MHIYGPPAPIPPFEDTVDQIPIRLYPCLNFTCSGTIVKMMFVTPIPSSTENIQGPSFALWKKCDPQYDHDCHVYEYNINNWVLVKRLHTNEVSSQQHQHVHQQTTVYEITFTGDTSFDRGYFLGVSNSASNSPGQRVNVLYQHGGSLCDAVSVHSSTGRGNNHNAYHICESSAHNRDNNIFPYIAVETDSESAGQTLLFVST